MKKCISILLPTRGRPEIAKRFFDSVADRSISPHQVEIILYLDEDDTVSHDLCHPALDIHKIIGPRRGMASLLSACLDESEGDVLALFNDDVIIQTHGWDEAVLAAHNSHKDHVYLMYGNDLWQGNRLCTFPIISREICRLLSHPFPDAYKGSLIDLHLMDIFRRLEKAGHQRVVYKSDLIFEHRHYLNGKAECDQTYTDRERFGDDPGFIGLRDFRQTCSERLLDQIQAKPAPVVEDCPVQDIYPNGFFPAAMYFFARHFLGDTNLPTGWRTYLFAKFCGRYLSRHGHLMWMDDVRRFLKGC